VIVVREVKIYQTHSFRAGACMLSSQHVVSSTDEMALEQRGMQRIRKPHEAVKRVNHTSVQSIHCLRHVYS
jgi:hypothetical protein